MKEITIRARTCQEKNSELGRSISDMMIDGLEGLSVHDPPDLIKRQRSVVCRLGRSCRRSFASPNIGQDRRYGVNSNVKAPRCRIIWQAVV